MTPECSKDVKFCHSWDKTETQAHIFSMFVPINTMFKCLNCSNDKYTYLETFNRAILGFKEEGEVQICSTKFLSKFSIFLSPRASRHLCIFRQIGFLAINFICFRLPMESVILTLQRNVSRIIFIRFFEFSSCIFELSCFSKTNLFLFQPWTEFLRGVIRDPALMGRVLQEVSQDSLWTSASPTVILVPDTPPPPPSSSLVSPVASTDPTSPRPRPPPPVIISLVTTNLRPRIRTPRPDKFTPRPRPKGTTTTTPPPLDSRSTPPTAPQAVPQQVLPQPITRATPLNIILSNTTTTEATRDILSIQDNNNILARVTPEVDTCLTTTHTCLMVLARHILFPVIPTHTNEVKRQAEILTGALFALFSILKIYFIST